MAKEAKYRVEHFDKEFFEGTTGEKGGDRINVSPESLGVVRGVVAVLAAVFHGKTFLDVGCGVGWFVKFLRELGETVKGVELSQYAVDRAIVGNIVQGDLRDLSHVNGKYDVVFAWNVMAYLVEDDIEKAINSMKRLSKGHLVFGIVTSEVLKALPHGKPGRLTLKPWKWWMAEFEKCGMEQDVELAAKMNKLGGGSWNIFCLKAKE